MTASRLNLVLIAAIIAAILLSLIAGKVWIAPFGDDVRASVIIAQLRLPRAALAVIIGAGLGMAGAAMQGFLRNPLADPGLFGIAPMAALGAVLSLYFGFAVSAWLLPIFALVGAGLAMALLSLIAGRSASLVLFTLAGMMIASLAGAFTALAISLAPTPFAMTEIVTWLMGALTDRSWRDVWIAGPLVALGCVILMLTARSLDALSLGETAARSMGVSMNTLQWLLIIGIGLTVGASVAVAGIIGFVGLVVPHLMRPLTDGRPSQLLIPSALAGALLLVIADSLVRLMPMAGELRLGIALSLIGGPFFLWLLLNMRRKLA